MTPSLEEWPTKAKETSSDHEVRLNMMDIKQNFMDSISVSQGKLTHTLFAWKASYIVEM